jgi:glycosyltransferase involved in cell wall biosynthesis
MKDKIGRAFDLPKEKIQVIHNGIPIDPFLVQDDRSIRKSLLNDGTCPVILTTARLVEHKGLEDLLQAAVQVPGAMFLVAGDGPLRSLLETQAKALGVDERVVFLGYREDLNQLLLACDFFVMPSHNEGLPLSILEAMAAGKAVVATHAGGIGEAVIDGETGWLVPVADPDRLAASIRSLLADPKLARRFGRAGRERVLRAFHVDVMVKKYTSTYESLLRSKGVGSGA